SGASGGAVLCAAVSRGRLRGAFGGANRAYRSAAAAAERPAATFGAVGPHKSRESGTFRGAPRQKWQFGSGDGGWMRQRRLDLAAAGAGREGGDAVAGRGSGDAVAGVAECGLSQGRDST